MPESPEKFTVECPQCGSRYAVAQGAVGKKARCRCDAHRQDRAFTRLAAEIDATVLNALR